MDNFKHQKSYAQIISNKVANQSNTVNLCNCDSVLPISKNVALAIHKACDELTVKETFKGYSDVQGYDFLRSSIATYDYYTRGVTISLDEIFISHGVKSDICNFIMMLNNIIGSDFILNMPYFPHYIDSIFLRNTNPDLSNIEFTHFNTSFSPPNKKHDIAILCNPNNPTGSVFNKIELQNWVNWANSHNALILYDNTYHSFITDQNVPHSIYECDGAKKCAIEFRSYSKSASFTGIKCGYTIVPNELILNNISINNLSKIYRNANFSTVSYITQRAANATYSVDFESPIPYYLKNAQIISQKLTSLGFENSCNNNSPFIWVNHNEFQNSWDLFDCLLEKHGIISMPGLVFGSNNSVRLSAFADQNLINSINIKKSFK